jgi:hypothetical protein
VPTARIGAVAYRDRDDDKVATAPRQSESFVVRWSDLTFNGKKVKTFLDGLVAEGGGDWVGSGGREHALAWKISRSPLVDALFAAPGNPGIAKVATLVPRNVDDVDGIARWAGENRIDLVVVGPEGPLVAGLADRVAALGIPVFGPSAAAAEIEGSKAFAKDVMRAAGIPTAEYGEFTELAPALAWARARGGRVVVKADGLAAGKGVVVCGALGEVEAALRAILVERVHEVRLEVDVPPHRIPDDDRAAAHRADPNRRDRLPRSLTKAEHGRPGDVGGRG